jgi:hypothetical protein
MTTTDLAGLPAEIAAVLARAGIPQDAACDAADIPRTSYYRRKRQPGAWRIQELEEFLATANARLEVHLAGHALDLDEDGVRLFRLAELATLANAMGSGLALGLETRDAATVATDG